METNLWGDALRASRRHRYSRFLTIQADKTEISTWSLFYTKLTFCVPTWFQVKFPFSLDYGDRNINIDLY